MSVPFTKVKILKMYPDVQIPQYETEGSAGFDLRLYEIDAGTAFSGPHKRSLGPGETACFGTGLKMAIPPGYELQIRSRSGLSLKGIVVANAPGTIDSDYRGEIKIILRNTSHNTFFEGIANGFRMAQGVLSPVNQAIFEEVRDLDDTARGEGGFGSTGTY